MTSITCICLIIVISGQLIYASSKECVTQQVKALFALDGTININDGQRDLMLRLVEEVVTSLPEGSEGGCVYINQESKEITRFTISGSRPNMTEEADGVQWNPTGETMTARALAKEVNVSFPVAFLQRKAEIFYLLVSDKTLIESFPEVLLKKKIFIVVFGSAIPDKLKNLASSTEHIKLISNFNDLNSVVGTVKQRTCRDSFLKCDVDEYMGKRASKCTSCMNFCSQTTSKQPRACKLHCPYILLPPREYAVKIVKDPLKDDIVTAVVEDNKYITLGVVISAFAFIIIFNVGIGVVCYRKNLLCFHRNARQINRHEIEMDIMQSFPLPDNVAVPETGGHGDNEPIQRHADGATQRLLDNLPSAEEYGQDRDGQHEPRDFLKNENEEEMNHLALGEPLMIDVQTGKCFGTRQSEDMN